MKIYFNIKVMIEKLINKKQDIFKLVVNMILMLQKKNHHKNLKPLNIILRKIYRIHYIKYNVQKTIYLIKIILINKLIFKVQKKKI